MILDGAWGFASGVALTESEAVTVAETAVTVAQVAAKMTQPPGRARSRAGARRRHLGLGVRREPVRGPARREDRPLRRLDPRAARRRRASTTRPAACSRCRRTSTTPTSAAPRSPSSGCGSSRTLEVHGADEATGVFDSMRTIAPPVGRGWEYLTGDIFDFAAERAELPELLREKLAAPSVEAGTYDLVIDPSNLWLTIHESIGHATELDRALGYEANYAGTSFATYDKLGTLQYGSPVMHVTGDRTSAARPVHRRVRRRGRRRPSPGTSSRDGVLVGYQLDRAMAHTYGAELNGGRSNGCAYADSPGHIPIQRMANVSLQPAPDGPDTAGLISQVERGIYVVGDKSWSIDMQRYNFQFTGQRFYRDRGRRADGPAARRRLPGHDHRLLGLDGGGRRTADLRARRRVQLRQGPTRPGRRGQPRLPLRPLPRHPDPEHHRGGDAPDGAPLWQRPPAAARRARTGDLHLRAVHRRSSATPPAPTCAGPTTP